MEVAVAVMPRRRSGILRPNLFTALLGAVVMILMALIAILANPLAAAFGWPDPNFIDQVHWQGYPLAPGIAGHLLGTDENGRDLLARLAAAPEVAISRETLMAQVWDENWFGPTKTLDVHVAALRRKLAGMVQLGSVPRITTLRGHGYRLEAPKA